MSHDEAALGAPVLEQTERSGQLARLFHEHASFVWRALRRLGLSATDAEDGTQEVFLVVRARLGDYEERGTAKAWLFAICQNVARARRQTTRHVLTDAMDMVEPPGSNPDPERLAQRAQAADLVRTFLGSLPEEQATAFFLVEVEGLSVPELASATGVGLNTCYARLRLARGRFSTFVERTAKGRER